MNFFQKITDAMSLRAEEGDIKFINVALNKLPNDDPTKTAFLSMQRNYFILRERYIHESGKKLQVTQDWKRYIQALYNKRGAKNATETDRLNIVMQEIERRFEEML